MEHAETETGWAESRGKIMDEKIYSILIGAAAGVIGYWFTTFWMHPILEYHQLRKRVLADMIFYGQVINPDDLNDRLQKMWEDRVVSNRKCSAELTACLMELPCWYICWLGYKGHRPELAAENLIGYSNTREYEAAAKREDRIKEYLGMTPPATKAPLRRRLANIGPCIRKCLGLS